MRLHRELVNYAYMSSTAINHGVKPYYFTEHIYWLIEMAKV